MFQGTALRLKKKKNLLCSTCIKKIFSQLFLKYKWWMIKSWWKCATLNNQHYLCLFGLCEENTGIFPKAIWLEILWHPLVFWATEYNPFINREATLRVLTSLTDVSRVIHSFLSNTSLFWISEAIWNIMETRTLCSVSQRCQYLMKFDLLLKQTVNSIFV